MIIYPDKTITSNPFVDNILYYSKLMAYNATIKDEEEALNNESVESLRLRELLISSVEKSSIYDIYPSIPKEIMEKYINIRSNIDIYAENNNALKVFLNSYSKYRRTKILDKFSSMARNIYIDHYEVAITHLEELGPTWFTDNKSVYDRCKTSNATYVELFDSLPRETVRRILYTYINNVTVTPIDDIIVSLDTFEEYIESRTDAHIDAELVLINQAMRDVFVSHYDIMVERGYVRDGLTVWKDYIDEEDTYKACINGTATYYDMYDLFPKESLIDSLNSILGEDIVSDNRLADSVDILKGYLDTLNNPMVVQSLNKNMSDKYLANYGTYLNFELYNRCLDEDIDYYELSKYLPIETRKMILHTEIKEVTNLQSYVDNKDLFDEYLNTLSRDERNRIKNEILVDMQDWYPSNHKETNNYYRSLCGLPPLDEDGNEMIDTLIHTWDNESKQFVEFGDRFISRIPEGIYPDIHWEQPLYKFDSYDIGILTQYGILEDWLVASRANINLPRYKYLNYLGDDKLDIYTCSRASNFQLVGIPSVDDEEFKRKFVDVYSLNRDYVIRTVYSDSHKFQSDYYNKFIIIFIMINTIIDCLCDIPEYIIDREIFDARCIKYLFESYGIPYYSEIPIKYQRAMLKNLNILIKYKSSTRNMVDICSLFGFSDVRVFNYYLFKDRLVEAGTGEFKLYNDNLVSYDLDLFYVMDKNGENVDYNGVRFSKMLDYRYYNEDKYTRVISIKNEDGTTTKKRIINPDANVYVHDSVANSYVAFKDVEYFKSIDANDNPAELKFVKVPVNESLTEYKNNEDYIIPYDEMVYSDEGDTWDAGEDHQLLYNKLLDHEFNAVKTKYVSVETLTEITELSFQVSYFYNMLFDNLYSEDGLTVEIPSIRIGHKFRFMDVICYVFALMYLYSGVEDNIMYSPTQILYIKGYNFDSSLNEILKDAKAFQQNNEVTGAELKDYQKYNIFSINDRIREDNYDYQQMFNDYRIKGFNLNCDIDELESWLNVNYKMSLDDFIVDDSFTEFDQVITLRNFYSLNNSYYQKNIFRGNLIPSPYNQNIKYSYNFDIYTKKYINDINDNKHECVIEDGYYMDIISNSSNEVFIMDYVKYITAGVNKVPYAIYNKYIKSNTGYIRADNIPYVRDASTNYEYTPLYKDGIYILDSNGKFILSADHYFIKNDDNTYTSIKDNIYFKDMDILINGHVERKRTLKFGDHYIYENGKWVPDPNKCYIRIDLAGNTQFILLAHVGNYSNTVVNEEDCYVRHSDGHFVRLIETDYYRKKSNNEEYNGYIYTEEDCYVISTTETEYFDPSVEDKIYYQKLSDYYSENNYTIYSNRFYIKDADGNYISQSELVDPNNCYYNNNGVMTLVIDSLGKYINYTNPINNQYVLILQPNNDYYKYKIHNGDYILSGDTERRYVYNSRTKYITVLYNSSNYGTCNSVIVVLNKSLSGEKDLKEEDNTEYNPEKTDGVWDENDWYYTDGYAGENMWYYRKPNDGNNTEEESDTPTKINIGSGFYFDASSYIGDINIESGESYYMAFDIETNFNGTIQITCDSDNSIVDIRSRSYNVTMNEKQHITQLFTANNITKPGINFLIYNYDEVPIEAGNYICISNMKFVKSYSKDYISQDIPSYDKLQDLYKTNSAIHKYLVRLMNNTDDKNMYEIYKKLYDALMTCKYNKEAFKIGDKEYAKTYTDFLETRDAVLYEQLCYFKSLNSDSMYKQIADNIIEVTYAIDGCIDTYSYGYLYSYFPAVSVSYIQQYITRIINFFKSWKVHLIGINTVYKFDDEWENTVKILESKTMRSKIDDIRSIIYTNDIVKINPIDDTNSSGIKYSDLYDLPTITDKFTDSYTIYDKVRIIRDDVEHITTISNISGVNLTARDIKGDNYNL